MVLRLCEILTMYIIPPALLRVAGESVSPEETDTQLSAHSTRRRGGEEGSGEQVILQ